MDERTKQLRRARDARYAVKRRIRRLESENEQLTLFLTEYVNKFHDALDREDGALKTAVDALKWVLVDEPEIWAHATKSENRASILKDGLRARAMSDNNYPDEDDHCLCVCMGTNQGRVPRWWDDAQSVDVWEVDVTGLPTEPYPNMDEGEGICVLSDTPPERLTLVATVAKGELVYSGVSAGTMRARQRRQ